MEEGRRRLVITTYLKVGGRRFGVTSGYVCMLSRATAKPASLKRPCFYADVGIGSPFLSRHRREQKYPLVFGRNLATVVSLH